MAFHDVSMPTGIAYGSVSGPSHATIIQETASRHEYRITNAAAPRRRLQPVKQLQTTAEAAALLMFAIAREGSLHSFRVKDEADFTTATDGRSTHTGLDQVLGTGTGASVRYQLVKVYDPSGVNPRTRTLTLPVSGTVLVSVNGTLTGAYTLDGTGGIVLTATAGHVVRAGCQFDVPGRFEKSVDEWAQMMPEAHDRWSMPNLGIVEVLSEVEYPERWFAGGAKAWGSIGADIGIALNDGVLHTMTVTAAINAFLPPLARLVSGHQIFAFACNPASTNNIQVRDDAGVAVGSAFGSGGGFKMVGLSRSGSVATWVLYG
jgi:uncharacterized protein (TIGR02217 family)